MNLTKPSVEAALRASIKKNDKGFTARDMQKAWGYDAIYSAQRRIKRMLDDGLCEIVGKHRFKDSMGRDSYATLYRTVKKKRA